MGLNQPNVSWSFLILSNLASMLAVEGSLACLQVLFAVFKGKKLEMPDHAPSTFSDLVRACMAQSPAERPSFPQIQDRIAALQAELHLS